jgi:hypothetical protein
MFFDPERIKKIISENALASEHLDANRIFAVKEELEKAQARRLQPHFIKSFFDEAFKQLGGSLKGREPERWEITHVPSSVRERDRMVGGGAPVMTRYERVCFQKDRIRLPGKPQIASFICPGHPLMNSVLDLTLERCRHTLRQGAILINDSDMSLEPKVMFIIEHSIRDAGRALPGKPTVISQRMQFALVGRDGTVSHGGYAPYLDYEPATADQIRLVAPILDEPWLKDDLEARAVAMAVSTVVPEHFREVRDRRHKAIEKTIQAVHERLTSEILYWNHRAVTLREDVKAGKQPRMQPDLAERRARELTDRLQARKKELENQRHVSSNTPVVVGAALVIPRGLLNSLLDNTHVDDAEQKRNDEIERIAMEAVMRSEVAMGRTPKDVSKQKIGWDITSSLGNGELLFIEVKGRQKDATTVTISRNEILTGLNKPDNFVLAIVLVDGEALEGPYYVEKVFNQALDFGVTSVNYDIKKLLAAASVPKIFQA